MNRVVWIFVAGGLGSATRYWIGLWAGKTFGTAFPYGTLMVNVTGCFLIAFVMHVALSTSLIPATLRLTLTTGFLGGLTTYSSFNYETTRLLEERAWGAGLANLALTLIGCFLAGLCGLMLARRLFGL